MVDHHSSNRRSVRAFLPRAPLASRTALFFPLLRIKTTDADSTTPSYSDVAIGALYLKIRQGSFSRTIIEEINPLDIGTFLGNVGGFWGTW